MALNIYVDPACTQLALPQQVFPGNGTLAAFVVNAFAIGSLASVYRETETSTSGVTFVSGVGSGFSGLTINALNGRRVIVNGQFVGTVVSNTATQITISDLTYNVATPTACILSAIVKLTRGVDYTLSGATINTLFTPGSNENIIANPLGGLVATYGGTSGTVVTKNFPIYIRRSPITGGGELSVYTNILATSGDLTQPGGSLTQTAVTFTSGVGSGFSGLVGSALVGRAVTHNGVYVGKVTANTSTTVTISDLTYNGASNTAVCFITGRYQLARDISGSPGTFAPALNLPDVTDDTITKAWATDTLVVPNAPTNYVDTAITLLAAAGLAP